MNYIVLTVFFVLAALLGYRIIGRVPPLLHTPLMSGMNALSGVTLLGGLGVLALAVSEAGRVVGIIAVVLAAVNVVGGFLVTHRMLRMFKTADGRKRGGDDS